MAGEAGTGEMHPGHAAVVDVALVRPLAGAIGAIVELVAGQTVLAESLDEDALHQGHSDIEVLGDKGNRDQVIREVSRPRVRGHFGRDFVDAFAGQGAGLFGLADLGGRGRRSTMLGLSFEGW